MSQRILWDVNLFPPLFSYRPLLTAFLCPLLNVSLPRSRSPVIASMERSVNSHTALTSCGPITATPSTRPNDAGPSIRPATARTAPDATSSTARTTRSYRSFGPTEVRGIPLAPAWLVSTKINRHQRHRGLSLAPTAHSLAPWIRRQHWPRSCAALPARLRRLRSAWTKARTRVVSPLSMSTSPLNRLPRRRPVWPPLGPHSCEVA